jgi:hypothetical protein
MGGVYYTDEHITSRGQLQHLFLAIAYYYSAMFMNHKGHKEHQESQEIQHSGIRYQQFSPVRVSEKLAYVLVARLTLRTPMKGQRKAPSPRHVEFRATRPSPEGRGGFEANL